jgi:hypothetical protein
MNQDQTSLDKVKSHFEHWRATLIKKRERIPEHLWDMVKTLIGQYSLSDITAALRINTSQIKDNLKIVSKINFVETQNESPELLTSRSIMPFTKNEQVCSFELHRANGVVLKVSSLPVVSLQHIITQLWSD